MRRRHARLASNPFVVFSDMTVALAFFFAIYGLTSAVAHSRALEIAERENRQKSVREQVVGLFRRVWPEAPYNESAKERKYIVGPPENPLAAVWENSNYQRISIYRPMFNRGEKTISALWGREVYEELAQILRPSVVHLAYLYVHGIAEPQEEPGQISALRLSRDRADEVRGLLKSAQLIAEYRDRRDETEQRASSLMPVKYVITYGTGNQLYTSEQEIGRVDLVLFYEDRSE